MLSLGVVALVCAIVSCGGGLRVEGDSPYTRCAAADPPPPRTWRVGALRLAIRERRLSIAAPRPLRIAAFSGPAPARGPLDQAVDRLVAARPHLALMLGDCGDDETSATLTFRALARAPFPTLVIAGGRDDASVLEAAAGALDAAARDKIVLVSTLREIALGRDTLVLVAGAPVGRYALAGGSCGFSESDLDGIEDDLGDSHRGPRWLVSWAAPSGKGPHSVTLGLEGADAGDQLLARWAESIGARGGLFAWPTTQAMRPAAAGGRRTPSQGEPASDLELVVPSLGAVLDRADGSRVLPGAAILTLDARGMALDPSSL